MKELVCHKYPRLVYPEHPRGFAALENAQPKKELVDYVNPNIGGIGQLLTATSALVKLTAGMASVAPITTPGITDRYLADKIYGFPAGGFTFMPIAAGAATSWRPTAASIPKRLRSAFGPQSQPPRGARCTYTQGELKAALGEAPAYQYIFSWRTPVLDGRPGTFHACEIAFVFDNAGLCIRQTGGGPAALALSRNVRAS
jgi:hypothetical protein